MGNVPVLPMGGVCGRQRRRDAEVCSPHRARLRIWCVDAIWPPAKGKWNSMVYYRCEPTRKYSLPPFRQTVYILYPMEKPPKSKYDQYLTVRITAELMTMIQRMAEEEHRPIGMMSRLLLAEAVEARQKRNRGKTKP